MSFPINIIHTKDAGEETQGQEENCDNGEQHHGTALLIALVCTLKGEARFDYAGLLLL
jgi:hypothetical protein